MEAQLLGGRWGWLITGQSQQLSLKGLCALGNLSGDWLRWHFLLTPKCQILPVAALRDAGASLRGRRVVPVRTQGQKMTGLLQGSTCGLAERKVSEASSVGCKLRLTVQFSLPSMRRHPRPHSFLSLLSLLRTYFLISERSRGPWPRVQADAQWEVLSVSLSVPTFLPILAFLSNRLGGQLPYLTAYVDPGPTII